MADHSGFEVIDNLGQRQVSDSFYDATMTNKIPINSRTHILESFYALQPTSSTNTIHSCLEFNATSSLIGGVGNVCVFDFSITSTPVSFGIEVYDTSGRITFSSDTVALDVIDVIKLSDITANSTNGIYFEKTYSNGVVPAVIPIRTPIWAVEGEDYWQPDLRTIGYCVQGSTLIAKGSYALKQGWARIPYDFYMDYEALIIDVKK